MHTHRRIYEQRVKKNLKASLKENYKVAYEYVVHVSFFQERKKYRNKRIASEKTCLTFLLLWKLCIVPWSHVFDTLMPRVYQKWAKK